MTAELVTPLRIFVSHSTKDNSFGTQLVQDLRHALGNKVDIWYDSEGGLYGGDTWWRKIVAELRARYVFIVILSPDAMDSNWVNAEIDIAWKQKHNNGPSSKLIIPLLYSPCNVRDDLDTLQIISFVQPNSYREAFNELLQALGLPHLDQLPLSPDEEPLSQQPPSATNPAFRNISPPVQPSNHKKNKSMLLSTFTKNKVLLPKKPVSQLVSTLFLLMLLIGVFGGFFRFIITSRNLSTTTSPTLPPPIIGYLSRTINLSRWGVKGYRPGAIDLTEKPPAKNWIEPQPKGYKRLYGVLHFGKITKVNLVLDELNDKQSQMIFAFNDDTNFSNKPKYITDSDGGLTSPIEFTIDYPNEVSQQYSIMVYYGISFNLQYHMRQLDYYRTSLREGTVNIGGVNYPIAIGDDNEDGLYSDLQNTNIWIDVNRDGQIKTDPENNGSEGNDFFDHYANLPFAINGISYIITDITSSGSRITITQVTHLSEISGQIQDEQTKIAVANAKVTILPLQLSVVTKLDGTYSFNVPESTKIIYWFTVVANGYIPQTNIIFSQPLVVNQHVRFDISISQITTVAAHSGVIRIKEGDSYHFLTNKLGSEYRRSTFDRQGDFSIIFHPTFDTAYKGNGPGFFASGTWQRGIQDLGNIGNVPLDAVKLPVNGNYETGGVAAVVGHTYISLAPVNEEGHYTVFRVLDIRMNQYIEIEFFYH